MATNTQLATNTQWKNGGICYCTNYESTRGLKTRSCATYTGGAWQYDSIRQQYYRVIQEACNGYSENGRLYDGTYFLMTDGINTGYTIEAKQFNELRDLINRELARRADYFEADGKPVTGTVADDAEEWHDPDFRENEILIAKLDPGDIVRAGQANNLINAWNRRVAIDMYKLSNADLQVSDDRLAETGEYAAARTLDGLYTELLRA